MYINNISDWGSLRRATSVAASLVFYTKNLPEGSELREMAKAFAKSQADYVQGNNPLGVDYVVGADATSPRSVHHRSVSGSNCITCEPLINEHILYGALAGGPDLKDNWVDDRSDYQKNEVALDYNVCYAAVLAYLVEEGLNVEDPIPVWEHDYRLTKNSTSTAEPSSCWATKLGYPCCKNIAAVIYTDSDGSWGAENGEWCGIVKNSSSCWSHQLGYKCCSSQCSQVIYHDNDGDWGAEDGEWCGIINKC